MRLTKKVALITGAAQGIGRSIALTFADEGASVGIVDIKEEMGLSVVEEITKKNGQAIFSAGDVSNAEDVSRAVNAVLDQFGRIDILVNNAAMSIKGTVTSLTEDQWDRIQDVNLKSIYLFSHLIIPIMAKQGGGVIINTASVTSLVGVRDFAAYVASKGGITSLTRAMALDHASEGVRVNSICPGGIITPMMDWQIRIAPDPAMEKKRIVDLHPIGRVATPEELAHLYVYLASDEASYITGAAFSFDGGYTAQ